MMIIRYVFIISFMCLLSCGKTDGVAPSTLVTPPGGGGGPPPPGSPPGDLVILDPAILSKLSNADLTISGSCESGATVFVTGDSSQNVTCVASAFSFTVNKAVSGNYFFNLYQTNANGSSSQVSVSWTYDIIAPPAVTISSPASNPYTSGAATISISGTCETGTTVNMTGDQVGSTACNAGSYILTGITKAVDGSYLYNITQTDDATNVSTSVQFNWIVDTVIPPTPTITNFADNPHYTNSSPLLVQGACVTGNTVTISEGGAVLASGACAGNAYSLNVAKGADGNYTLAVFQTDVDLNDSALRDFTWILDTQAPAAPVISSPGVSPVTSSGDLTVQGSCEINATVNLTGDETQNQLCTTGNFSFVISEAVDGTYNYSITQTDLAANTSGADTQQWIRDSAALPIPLIITPATDPFISNAANLILSGECQTGLTVQLAGVLAGDVLTPAGSLTQTCAGGAFSYTINKADGTYGVSVTQTNGITTSGSDSLVWIKDTVEPNTTISVQPANPNLSSTANFEFAANETSTYQCQLDGASYATCVSPLAYSNMTNGAHTLNVRAIDSAGNIESTPASYAWSQSANNTIALYHLDVAAPLVDSSNYGGALNNVLTDNASANLGTAKFLEGRTMATTANYMRAVNTSSQQAIQSYMTIDAWVRLTGLPGSYAPIVSKSNAYEYGIRRQGSKYYMYFRGSLNGTSYTEVRSAALTNAQETALTAGFVHLAVTWNLGTVKYYFNGVSKGTSTIGTVGTAKITASANDMRLGYNGTTSLNGSVDEVRVSQIVRYNTTFTPAAAAYTAD